MLVDHLQSAIIEDDSLYQPCIIVCKWLIVYI